MTYKQLMRYSSCRALMREDLEAAEHKHHQASHRKATAHHKGTPHHKSGAHHKATARHNGS
jgi:hypothetical protein